FHFLSFRRGSIILADSRLNLQVKPGVFRIEHEGKVRMGLTVKRVARLKEPGRYLDSNGLDLQVISAPNRNWRLRYELHARYRQEGMEECASSIKHQACKKNRGQQNVQTDEAALRFHRDEYAEAERHQKR